MKPTIPLVAIALAFCFSTSTAQITQSLIQWQNTIGGNDDDQLRTILQTVDGGCIMGGYTWSDSSGDKSESSQGTIDFWVVKLNSEGVIEWQNTIGGNLFDYLSDIDQTTDGGYILGGYSQSGISGDKTDSCRGSNDYWVVKLDNTGAIEWQNTIGGSSTDQLNGIEQTTDGGYILAGYSFSGISGDKTEASLGNYDYWVVKLDGSGIIEWQNTIGGSSNDQLNGIEQTTDGGYILGGYSQSGMTGDKTEASLGGYDYWVVKLDGSGVIEWQNTIGGSGYDYLSDIHQTIDDGYILGGYSQSGISGDKTEASLGGYDYWVVKLDGSGIIEWQNTIGGSSDDDLYGVQQTDDGFILGGYSSSGISGDKTEASWGTDYWVVKLSSSNTIKWQSTIGGNSTDRLYSLQKTSDGRYLLGGSSQSGISGDKTEASLGNYDYWAIKLSDECLTGWFFADADDDGYGSPSVFSCDSLPGYLTNNIDCDDNNEIIHPGSEDFCANGIDDDCNGVIDQTECGAAAIEWQNTIGGSYDEGVNSIQQTTDGGYIIGGSSNSPVSGDKTEDPIGYFPDYWIVKLDSAGAIEWQNTIGSTGNDFFSSVRQTEDGGYIVGGNTNSGISGDKTESFIGGQDYWVVKLDSVGNIEWQNTIGGVYDDWLNYVEQTADLGYIIAGYSDSPLGYDKGENNIGYDDYWVVKLNSAGNIEWQNTIGGNNGDYLYSIQQTADGGYILGGSSSSDISGDKTENSMGYSDYWVVKLDSVGNIEWDNTIGGDNSDALYSVRQTNDVGYILAGHSASGISGDKTEPYFGGVDCWIVKLDSSGSIQWQKTIGGNLDDATRSIEQTSDGGYIIGAGSNSGISGNKTEASMGSYDPWVVKLDSTGNILWQNTIGGTAGDGLASLHQVSDGGYILGGYSTSNISGDKTEAVIGGTSNSDCWVIKLKPECSPIQFYADLDGDNYGNATVSVLSCTVPPGFLSTATDCNDGDPAIHPGASEIPGNGVDDNCDGQVDELCSSDFVLIPDSLLQHHYWGLNNSTGTQPINYVWYWGDGATDSIAYPSHTYAAGGFYAICLTISDSTGCTDSTCFDYTIQKLSGENTIVEVNIVDSIPSIPTAIQNTNVLQSWSVFPNLVSGKSFINYTLSTAARVSIALYDVLGNKLQQLVNGDQEQGEHNTTIDARRLANGIYVLQIRAGNQIAEQKIVVMN